MRFLTGVSLLFLGGGGNFFLLGDGDLLTIILLIIGGFLRRLSGVGERRLRSNDGERRRRSGDIGDLLRRGKDGDLRFHLSGEVVRRLPLPGLGLLFLWNGGVRDLEREADGERRNRPPFFSFLSFTFFFADSSPELSELESVIPDP